jgi:hypothetical protein
VVVGDPAHGQVGNPEGNASVEDAADEAFGEISLERCWRVPRVASLDEVRLPPEVARHVSVDSLVKAFSKRQDPDERLIICPKTANPFWWKYMKYCSKCAGDPLCLIGLIQSKIFQEALHAHAH